MSFVLVDFFILNMKFSFFVGLKYANFQKKVDFLWL